LAKMRISGTNFR